MAGIAASVVVCGGQEPRVREAVAFFNRFGFDAVGAVGTECLKSLLRQSNAEAVVLLSGNELTVEDSVLLHVCSKNSTVAEVALALRLNNESEKKVNGNPRPRKLREEE